MKQIVENTFKIIGLLATKIFLNFSESHGINYKMCFKIQYSQHIYSQCKIPILVIYYSDFPCNNLGQSCIYFPPPEWSIHLLRGSWWLFSWNFSCYRNISILPLWLPSSNCVTVWRIVEWLWAFVSRFRQCVPTAHPLTFTISLDLYYRKFWGGNYKRHKI